MSAACFERYTAAELGAMLFNPLPYIVDPILAPGATLLVGKPKVNKSWLVQEISLAVASGERACGEWTTHAGDVLFFACEDNRRRMRGRLDKLRPHWELPKNLTIQFGAHSLSDGFEDDVKGWADSVAAPRLVVIDTLHFARPRRPYDRLSYQADYTEASALTAFAAEMQLAILAVHHMRKMDAEDPLDAVSGTTGLAAGFDTVLAMSRTPEGLIKLEGRGRDIAPVDLALRFESDPARWSVMGDPVLAAASKERRAILDCLGQVGEAGPKEIARRTGLSAESVRQMLGKMSKEGLIKRTGYGSYAPTHTDHSDHTRPQTVNGVSGVMGAGLS